jgi:hypothetical protein
LFINVWKYRNWHLLIHYSCIRSKLFKPYANNKTVL